MERWHVVSFVVSLLVTFVLVTASWGAGLLTVTFEACVGTRCEPVEIVVPPGVMSRHQCMALAGGQMVAARWLDEHGGYRLKPGTAPRCHDGIPA